MKPIKQLYEELSSWNDFRILLTGFDGGMGEFSRGSQRGMTVIWSWGGGWEHVSMDDMLGNGELAYSQIEIYGDKYDLCPGCTSEIYKLLHPKQNTKR